MKAGDDGMGTRSSTTRPLCLAFAASACCVLAVLSFGAAFDGYSQQSHAVAVLGATGVPHAGWFNALGFVLPGLVLSGVAMGLYLRMASTAGFVARLGAWMALFSTLAFAAQGVFPLDPEHLDATSTRLHVAAWCLWWLTTGTGGLLLSPGLWRARGRRRWSVAVLAIALLVPGFALFAPAAWGSAIPQRIAYALWFAGWLLVAGRLSRSGASIRGSSPPART
jgi:hypothetical membrane protein